MERETTEGLFEGLLAEVAGEGGRSSRPYLRAVHQGKAPIMVFPKRSEAGCSPELSRSLAEASRGRRMEDDKEGVHVPMEDTLKKQKEAPSGAAHERQTDEVGPAISQVIPLNSAYERAGLAPPVPPASAAPPASPAVSPPVSPVPTESAPSHTQRMPLDSSGDPLINDKVAGYIIEDVVAAGGMGIVYRARQPVIGRHVAIKVLRPEVAEAEEQAERFFKEAQVLSAIRHRGVTDIIQWGRLADNRQYIVMEYLEGETLEDAMGREGAMPVYRVIEIIGEVLDALAAAHKAGIVHRDLKPSNIFIAKQSDGTQCVKLVDFGLARQVPENALEGADSKLGTEKASTVAGTPEYIAPEQAKGLAATPRTDIYSLGVLTYELLAGKLPFHTQSTVEMMRAHAYNEAPDIRDSAENIPSTLAELLSSMLKKSPEDRPRSTDEVKQKLHRISQQLKNEDTHIGVLPRHLRLEGEAPPPKKLLRIWWPLIALPLVAGIGIYAGLRYPQEGREPTPPTPEATEKVAVAEPTPKPPVAEEPPAHIPPEKQTETATEEPPPAGKTGAKEQPTGKQTKKKTNNQRSTPATGNTEETQPAPAAQAQEQAPKRPASQATCEVLSPTLRDKSLRGTLRVYSQYLTATLGESAPAALKTEAAAHRERIATHGTGSPEDCRALSAALDAWLKARAPAP